MCILCSQRGELTYNRHHRKTGLTSDIPPIFPSVTWAGVMPWHVLADSRAADISIFKALVNIWKQNNCFQLELPSCSYRWLVNQLRYTRIHVKCIQGSKREVTLASVYDVRVAFVPIRAIAAITWRVGGGIHAHTVAANTCVRTRVLSFLASLSTYFPVQDNWNYPIGCLIEHLRIWSDIAGVETESCLFHHYHVVARVVFPYLSSVVFSLK